MDLYTVDIEVKHEGEWYLYSTHTSRNIEWRIKVKKLGK